MKRTHSIYFLFAGLLLLGLTSCSEDRLDIDVSGIDNEVEIRHFGKAFFGTDSADFYQYLPQLIEEYPLFFSSGDSMIWVARRFDTRLNQLWIDSKKILSPKIWEGVESQLTDGFKHYYYYYPSEKEQNLFTHISDLDFEYPVLYLDSLDKTFIALDVFMGMDHPAYATIPDYIKRRFTPDYIAPKVFEQIASSKLPLENDNATLVEDMIRMGMIRYFQEAMLRTVAPELFFGYTPEQIQFCTQNETGIWTYLVENQLLFDSSIDSKRRFIFEAPFSKFYTDIDNNTPGRIGEWIGWRIIHSYMEVHPETSLSELMQIDDYEKLFRESKYKPTR